MESKAASQHHQKKDHFSKNPRFDTVASFSSMYCSTIATALTKRRLSTYVSWGVRGSFEAVCMRTVTVPARSADREKLVAV